MEILQIGLLGLVFGITPGPLLTLALSHVVSHNRREGILTLMAPLLTDLPIAVLSILLLSRLSFSGTLIIVISFIGAAFIIYLAVRNFIPKKQGLAEDAPPEKPSSLKKGVITNFLNPAVYIFWMTIGGKGFLEQWNKGIGFGLLYIAALYICNIGASFVVVYLADRFKGFLSSKGYVWTLRIISLCLLYFAGKMIYDAVGMIK